MTLASSSIECVSYFNSQSRVISNEIQNIFSIQLTCLKPEVDIQFMKNKRK